MRHAWLGLLFLTLTCERPAPVRVAHAKPPVAAAVAKPTQPSAVSLGPGAPTKAPESAALVPGPLAHFFWALTELRQQKRQRHVRVFWLGDSHTNADFLSGAVRSALRESFGDGGPGFVRVGVKPYRHDGVKVSRQGSWNIDPDPPARRSPQDDGVFGVAGTRAVPSADASFSARVTTRAGASDAASFDLSYTLPERASFFLELGGKKQRVDAKTPADVAASGIAHLTLTAPLDSTLVLSPLAGAPRLFGLVVERTGAPGVVLDTVGIDGARLDDCVDYFTYVIVPMFFAVHTGMLPPTFAVPVAALVMVTSGFGFARSDAKTADHFFTGFPSYWNIVVFYLYVLEWPPPASALLLSIFAIGVFVPIRYVYPSRTPTLRALTVGLGVAWGAAVLVALYQILREGVALRPLVLGSLLFPVYYFVLSLVLTSRRVSR